MVEKKCVKLSLATLQGFINKSELHRNSFLRIHTSMFGQLIFGHGLYVFITLLFLREILEVF